MGNDTFWLNLSGPWHNRLAGLSSGWMVQIKPEAIELAAAWERVCRAAAVADQDLSSMGLLQRYIHPLMRRAMKEYVYAGLH